MIKFSRFPKYKPKGLTNRRLANSKKALKKQRDALPLLANWVEKSQPSPEERILNFDDATATYWQRLRANRAKDWIMCRQIIRSAPNTQEFLEYWNNCNLPKDPCYLLEILRTKFNLKTFIKIISEEKL
ncbi:hypothetical protein [Geminocystis sp. NIES-3709]|uniref:hypothetical protein n=1 Tax=Geminocystis sp. NIES-3709 TaxID=1617448 RepID=UPI000826174A|nr:hypothetical protein [Geminocystis sp. NIES-3709]